MKKVGKLKITGVSTQTGVPGGELSIQCQNFVPGLESKVLLGDAEAFILSSSEDRVRVRLPENPYGIGLTLRVGNKVSPMFPFNLAVRLAAELHPVANPVIAPDGSIITTISGSRGQQVDQPLVRITRQGDKFPYPCEIMNPTGLAFSPDGNLHVTSRNDGTVLKYTNFDQLEIVAEDLGIPTGLAFDSKGNMFVGDRTGRIWKIDATGRKEEFIALESSISAYHLAIDGEDRIYVTGPTFAVRDCLYRISADGKKETLLKGLSRPQGLAFLPDGDLLIATGCRGRKGIFRYGVAEGLLQPFVAAPTLVGLAIADGTIYLVAGDALYSASLPGHSVN